MANDDDPLPRMSDMQAQGFEPVDEHEATARLPRMSDMQTQGFEPVEHAPLPRMSDARAQGFEPVEPETEGVFGTLARKFAHSVVPTLAGVATGVETGALGGAIGGPWGAVAGGLLGGIAGGYAAATAQEAGLKALGYDDSHQQAVNAQMHPVASAVGEFATVPLAFGRGVATLGQRAGTAAITGGLEAGTEYAQGEDLSLARIGTSAALGAALPRPRGSLAPFEAHGAATGAKLKQAWHGAASSDAAAGEAKVQPSPPNKVPSTPEAAAPVPPAETPGARATETTAEGIQPDQGVVAAIRERLPPEPPAEPTAPPQPTEAQAQPVRPEPAPPAAPAQPTAPEPPAEFTAGGRENEEHFLPREIADRAQPLTAAAVAAPAENPRVQGNLHVEPNPDGPGHVLMRGDEPVSTHPNLGQAFMAMNRAAKADMQARPLQGAPEPPAAAPATPAEAIGERTPGQTVGDVLTQPRSLGAAVAGDIPPAAPPTPPPGRLVSAIRAISDKLFDIGRDIQMKVAPMATGTRDSMAAAKDFANIMRGIDHDWSLADQKIERQFDPEQRQRIWNAMDEESVMRQRGETSEHMGIATLEPEERALADSFQPQAQARWARMTALGMVRGEGLPYWTPRMLANGVEKGEAPRSLDRIGGNLQTTTGSLRGRKYQFAEETEAAMKKHFGEQAGIARDVRVMPLALAKLDKAIAGRELINKIREIGNRTGQPTVVEGSKPSDPDHSWFTIDHPAFYTSRPRMERADPATPLMDRNDNPVIDRVPLYVRGDFEGPLRSVLTKPPGLTYSALMDLKGKTMGLIMNSPLIHNAVEWGRALPAMPGKVATFKIYFEGNRAKNDPATMREAIDAGLVPIGKRFFNQDISSIMEQPNLTPGRSWTSQVLGFVPGLFDAKAGTAVKSAIDRAGDVWHNTLLWDRVGDLQMGLYSNFRDDLVAKGIDAQSAARIAAHWANRYAGALPPEAMSDAARKIANMLLFSRSFTLGNLGAMKDMLNGLPRDVRAQISRDVGSLDPKAEGYIKSLAQRKAISIVMLDMGLMYLGNSLLQSGSNVLRGDKTLEQEGQGYADRLSAALRNVREHPLSLLQPLSTIGSLSSTAENEPGKQDRILVGHTKDGTAIYARNPAGKIGEEFTGYLSGPLDMLRRKLGTIARPVWQILANDKGFGRKIYDPNADVPEKYLKNAGAIASHLAQSQAPELQLRAAADLARGEGDPKLAALQTFGPIAGVTFSRGAPGGPAAGELFRAQEQQRFNVNEAMPDIRRMILNGDVAGARQQMRDLRIPPHDQNSYIRTTLNPALRLSPRAVQRFNRYATPEQRARFQRARQQSAAPSEQ